jgi:hypothetical protein
MGDATTGDDVVELWRHADPSSTRMWEFKELVNRKYNLKLRSYDDLYEWSIGNIPEFWEETWFFCGIKASRPFDKVIAVFLVTRGAFGGTAPFCTSVVLLLLESCHPGTKNWCLERHWNSGP